MGVRGNENRKDKENKRDKQQKRMKETTNLKPPNRGKVEKQLEKEESKKNDIFKMFNKIGKHKVK